jgi:hypothetical protein
LAPSPGRDKQREQAIRVPIDRSLGEIWLSLFGMLQGRTEDADHKLYSPDDKARQIASAEQQVYLGLSVAMGAGSTPEG